MSTPFFNLQSPIDKNDRQQQDNNNKQQQQQTKINTTENQHFTIVKRKTLKRVRLVASKRRSTLAQQ